MDRDTLRLRHWLWIHGGGMFDPEEIKRLIIYRNAVQIGFYTDWPTEVRAA